MQNKELIEKWLSGSLSAEEQELFRQSEDFKKLEALENALQDYKAPEFNVEGALSTLLDKKKPAAKVVKFRMFDTVLKVAASVSIIVLGYLLIVQNKTTTFSTGTGQKELVGLPDKSSVRLNASSLLTYNSSEWFTNREVELNGEAYFIVAKGSRFNVNTEDGTVTVLGTQFNVKSRPGFFEVECYEGHVAVAVNQDTIQLLAGNGVRFVEGEKRLLTVEHPEPSWTNNESSFDSVPFAAVIAEFERQYDVNVQTKNVDLTKYYSGSFTHTDFDIALKSIANPLNLTIEKTTDKNIVLSTAQD